MLSDILIVSFVFLLIFVVFLTLGINTAIGYEPYIETCPTDYCATNIFNGKKRCPQKEHSINLEPGVEVCNPPYSCEGVTPYAILSDGSTTSTGICEEGITCSCTRIPYCADYITSYFTVVGRSPYERIEGTNAVVYQHSGYTNSAGNSVSSPPLALPENGFCSVPTSWLNNLYPPSCLVGNLFYLTPRIENFNPLRDSLACISEKPCERGISVFEKETRKIYCI